MCQFLRDQLAEHHIKGEVNGRVKNFYSIYRKLQAQQITLDELYDLLAFRIIVDAVHDCYETLGVIHAIFRPVPGRLKDYIGMPKGNMYQSIHTTVIGQGGERLKRISTETRQELEKLLNAKVFLEVWVKVKSGWADDEARVKSFGYE
jgi:GTP pyrophosphokinase